MLPPDGSKVARRYYHYPQRSIPVLPCYERLLLLPGNAAHLEQRRQAGEILSWHFEAYTLKLADNCRYTPDFMVLLPDGTMQFHEVKGFWMDDAKVKIKVAARQFPHIFLAIRKTKDGWETTDFTDNY